MTFPVWGTLLVTGNAGEPFEMNVKHIEPFGLYDLLDRSKSHRVRATGSIVSPTSAAASKDATVDFDLELRHTPTIFTLVLGGWVVPALTRPRTLMLDRNVLDRIVRYGRGSGRAEDKASVEELLGSNATLNVGMCAFEGNARREPSRDEFLSAYSRAAAALRAAAPHVRQVEPTQNVLEAGFQNLLDAHKTYERENLFLEAVAPLLIEPVSKTRLRNVEDSLFEYADRTNLPPSSFTLLLALACLYEDRGDPGLAIARRVLNPKRSFDSGDAHNSIADLRCLQFAAMGMGIAGDDIGVCTSDIALAKLWCALSPCRGRWNGRRFDVTLSISTALFQSMSRGDRIRLARRLARFHSVMNSRS